MKTRTILQRCPYLLPQFLRDLLLERSRSTCIHRVVLVYRKPFCSQTGSLSNGATLVHLFRFREIFQRSFGILDYHAAYLTLIREKGLRLNSATGLPFHGTGVQLQLCAPLVTSRFVGLLAPTEHLGYGPQIPSTLR